MNSILKKWRSLIISSFLLFFIATFLAQKTKIPKEKDRGGYLIVYFKDDPMDCVRY